MSWSLKLRRIFCKWENKSNADVCQAGERISLCLRSSGSLELKMRIPSFHQELIQKHGYIITFITLLSSRPCLSYSRLESRPGLKHMPNRLISSSEPLESEKWNYQCSGLKRKWEHAHRGLSRALIAHTIQNTQEYQWHRPVRGFMHNASNLK